MFFLSVIIGLAYSCNAQKVPDGFCREKKNLASHFMESEIMRLDLQKEGMYQKIAFNVPNIGNLSVIDLFSDDYFGLIQNFKIDSEDDIVHFDELFDEKEYAYLKMQFSCYKTESWADIIGQKHFKSQEEKPLEKISYSIPVFSKKGEYAFVYVESEFSGDLKVYKMIHGEWEYFAQHTIWIE